MRRRLAECTNEWQARQVADSFRRMHTQPELTEMLGEDAQRIEVRKSPTYWLVESVDRSDPFQSEDVDVSFP